ncbi:MAG: pyocin knob domain-containing protein [Candidatus Enterosoma sp.]|nr:pyocin knob domain-containing protein [Candidatus Enterosoma sp.]
MDFATGINLETGKTELFDFINVSKSGTYKGLWDASTNIPFLTNGTGEDGDYYEVSVGGTVNFGDGDIIFVAGDTVAYSRGKWQKGDKPLINDEETSYDTTWSSAKILQVIETASTADIYTYKGETAVLPDNTEKTPNNKGDVWLLTTDGLPYWWDGDIWRRFGVDAYTKTETENVIEEKLEPVETKLESALKYRGAVNTTALLPASAENGDTYFVKADGFMYTYNSTTSAWDALGTVAGMTNYFTKTEITAMLQDKADKFQYDVLPTPSSETVGLLLQYTGADTEDYKNSYFYKGIDNGNDTYSWELAKICDCYSKSEVDDSGLCAHGDNAPFLTNSTITDYLTGLDAKYKFATFTVDQDNATVSDKVNTTQWFSYNCYRQNNSWRVTVTDSATGKEIYTTDISAGNPVSWSKLATTDSILKTIQLSGAVDCNTLTETGLYTASAGAVTALTNIPADIGSAVQLAGGFSILVTNTNIGSICYGMQMFIPYGSDVPFIRKSYYLNGQYWTSWEQVATKSDLTASTDIALTTYTNSAFSIIELKAVRLGLNTIQVAGILEINSQCETLTFASGLPIPKVVTLSSHSMQIQAMCYRGTSSGTSERVLINKDGSMTVYTNTSGGNLYFSCEYTCI